MAVLDIQAGRLTDHESGPPLGQRPDLQRGQRVRHFVDERLGEAEMPATAGGRIPPGQGNLGSQATAAPGGRHPGRGLRSAPPGVERSNEARLPSRRRGLQALQGGDAFNQLGFLRTGVERQQFIEHVFDYMPYHRPI